MRSAQIAVTHLSAAVLGNGALTSKQEQQSDDNLPNANHIFRTLISALRQFPSSINHNGISFFLATIPAGTQLYHGRGDSEPIRSGYEWLALEPEHAANFAASICFPDDDENGDNNDNDNTPQPKTNIRDSSGYTPNGSVKWWLTPDEILALRRGTGSSILNSDDSEECNCSSYVYAPAPEPTSSGPSDSHPSSNHFLPLRHSDQQQQQILEPHLSDIPSPFSKPPKEDRPRPPRRVCIQPGYLHTYSPTSDLHLLYIDGQSAAKSPIGTLSSQDEILLRNSTFRPGDRELFREDLRASGLCELATKHWGGAIDGFVRMEHGFEVILCDFGNDGKVKFEGSVKRSQWSGLGIGQTGSVLEFWRAIGEDRYWAVGRGRMKLWSEEWVSAFAVDGLDLWNGSVDGVLPSLDSLDEATAERLREQLRDMVVQGQQARVQSGKGAVVEWQAVADLYVQRYATRLQYLLSLDDAEKVVNATNDIYMVYLDNADHSSDAAANAIDRCTSAFIPTTHRNISPNLPSLPQRAIITIAHKICSSLHSLTLPPVSHDLAAQKQHLQNLTTYLRWPQWIYCNSKSGSGCALDEVCFTAIWPWGSQEDHDSPSCRNETGLWWKMTHWGGEGGGGPGAGYWRMGEMQ